MRIKRGGIRVDIVILLALYASLFLYGISLYGRQYKCERLMHTPYYQLTREQVKHLIDICQLD